MFVIVSLFQGFTSDLLQIEPWPGVQILTLFVLVVNGLTPKLGGFSDKIIHELGKTTKYSAPGMCGILLHDWTLFARKHGWELGTCFIALLGRYFQVVMC